MKQQSKQRLKETNEQRKKVRVENKALTKRDQAKDKNTVESLFELICGEPCEEVRGGQWNMRLGH